MKYLKRFNEAIIDPMEKDIEDFEKSLRSHSGSIEELKDIGKDHNIEIISYSEFMNSLSEDKKKSAPPKGVPFFAFYDHENDLIKLILNDSMKRIPPPMYDHMIDVLRHELIHKEQNKRYPLSKEIDPKNRKDYFSDKSEIMAFSFSLAKELFDQNSSIESSMKRLPSHMLFRDIKSNVDDKVLKRYYRYIYLYLEKLFKGNEG